MTHLYDVATHDSLLFRSFRSYVLGHVAYQDISGFRQTALVGKAGSQWTYSYFERPAEYYLENLREPLELCSRIVRLRPTCRFMQIGCAGGRELSILARQFPQAWFHGIDLNPEAIERNQQAYIEIPNLSFSRADVLKPDSWGDWRPDVIYSSGCLEYLAESEALEFFTIALNSGIQDVVLFEPCEPGVHHSSRPRGGGAYAHDYADLLRRAGWEHMESSATALSGCNVLVHTRRY